MTRRGLALILFAGCYNPNLGAHPFLCGPPPERACPDGYQCDVATNVCVNGAAGSAFDAPTIPHDGGASDAMHAGIQCTPATAEDKDLEPNDTPREADQGQSHLGSSILCHPVASGPCNPYGAYTRLEICTPTDVDYYGMPLKAGDHLQIQVLFHEIVGDLDAAVLDATGRFITISAGDQDNEFLDFTAPAEGEYYLLVEGYMGQTNTYDLNFTKL